MSLTLAQLSNPGTLDNVRQLVLNALAGLGFVAKLAGSGSGGLSVSGTPTSTFDVRVKVVTQGELGTAQIQVSNDGGQTYAGAVVIPVTGIYAVPLTGVSLIFTAGPSAPSFQVGRWPIASAWRNFAIDSSSMPRK